MKRFIDRASEAATDRYAERVKRQNREAAKSWPLRYHDEAAFLRRMWQGDARSRRAVVYALAGLVVGMTMGALVIALLLAVLT